MGKTFSWGRRTKTCPACARKITVIRNKDTGVTRFVLHTKARGSKAPCRDSGAVAE